MKKVLMLILAVAASIQAHPSLYNRMGKEDSQSSLSVKPVKSPFQLLDKILKKLDRDRKRYNSEKRDKCALQMEASFFKDTLQRLSVSCIYRGELGIGLNCDRITGTESTTYESPQPLTDREKKHVQDYLFVLATLSPLYATKPYIPMNAKAIPMALSPLQNYYTATKWYNLSADEVCSATGEDMYRLKFSRNSAPKQKHLSRRQEPGDISGTAYFDKETLRLISFKGCAYLPTADYDTRLHFSADYDDEAGMPLLRQTDFVWHMDSIVIKGSARRKELPRKNAVGRCATEVTVRTPGSLTNMLTQAQMDTCTQLKVAGKLNSADIRLLRQMGGNAQDKTGSVGRLSFLDMSEATFANDKTPYLVLDAHQEFLAATAVPGRVRKHEHYLGKSSPSQSSIDYDRYRNIYWNESRPHPGSLDYMHSSYESVSYYYPKMYLGQFDGRSAVSASDVFVGSDRTTVPGYVTSRLSEGNYLFADTITPREWKEMKRRKLTRFKGHRLKNENSGYFLYVYTKKGLFPHDMFYKCTSLQTVVLPKGMHIDYSVQDNTSQTKYIEK